MGTQVPGRHTAHVTPLWALNIWLELTDAAQRNVLKLKLAGTRREL